MQNPVKQSKCSLYHLIVNDTELSYTSNSPPLKQFLIPLLLEVLAYIQLKVHIELFSYKIMIYFTQVWLTSKKRKNGCKEHPW